jgi:membrane protease YdiL (CAAX protease family)
MYTAKKFDWRIFFILLAAATFGVIAILPYTLALQQGQLEALKDQLPYPLPVLLTLQVLQNVLLFAVAIGLGMLAANRIGLGLPILEAKLAGEKVGAKIKAILPISIIIGVVGSLIIIALDLWIFNPALMAQLGEKAQALNLQIAQPAAWKGLLASFYGGINEEILLRLFIMSVLAWLGKFISHTADGRPTTAVFWIANILAAVLFGLGHLPATAGLLPLTPLVITRAIVLNGLLGIAFGYLYMTRGLESAMISHFSADIVLHVLLAL